MLKPNSFLRPLAPAVLFVASALSALAQTAKPVFPEPATYDVRLARMKAACLTEARAGVQAAILPVAQLGYTQTFLDKSLKVIGKPIHYGVDQLRVAGRPRAERDAARALMAEVESLLSAYVGAHPSMTEYQRACLATCASAHLIDYQLWAYNDPEVPSSVLRSGRGLCRHFAMLADQFLATLGIRGQVISGQTEGGDHAFNRVRINNEQLWMEPQRDTCQFYRK